MWDMQVVVMWDMRVVDKVEEAVGSFSVFCKFKSVVDQFDWAFTSVYGPNSVIVRRLLWEELFGLSSWWNVPWCVGGDFNAVRFPFERVGSTVLQLPCVSSLILFLNKV